MTSYGSSVTTCWRMRLKPRLAFSKTGRRGTDDALGDWGRGWWGGPPVPRGTPSSRCRNNDISILQDAGRPTGASAADQGVRPTIAPAETAAQEILRMPDVMMRVYARCKRWDSGPGQHRYGHAQDSFGDRRSNRSQARIPSAGGGRLRSADRVQADSRIAGTGF